MRWRDLDITALIVASGGTAGCILLAGGASPAEAATVAPVVADPASSSVLNIAVLIMAIATAASVATSLYLYRWRRILLADPKLLVPEELGKYLGELGQSVTELGNAMSHGLQCVEQATGKNSADVANMIETFMTLQKAVDERDEEIKRYRRGYDAQAYRRFINRFIRVDQFIDACLESGPESADELRQVRRLLQDALDECGVEAFAPEVGADSRKADGIADNPKTARTDRSADAFRIVEVIEPGYRLNGGDGAEVLLPAKVRIAVFES